MVVPPSHAHQQIAILSHRHFTHGFAVKESITSAARIVSIAYAVHKENGTRNLFCLLGILINKFCAPHFRVVCYIYGIKQKIKFFFVYLFNVFLVP